MFKPAHKIEKEIKKEDEEMDKQSDGESEEDGEEEESEEEEEEEEGDLYDRVLRAIPEELRSDGVFGLKVNRNNNRVGQIGRYTFQVMNNNRIEFHTADEWPLSIYKQSRSMGVTARKKSKQHSFTIKNARW